MALLDRRFGYMRAAARIKKDRQAVRDDARKAQVVENAALDARARNLPAESLARIWEELVETSISYEDDHWLKIRPK